jgi:hypothetical protein
VFLVNGRPIVSGHGGGCQRKRQLTSTKLWAIVLLNSNGAAVSPALERHYTVAPVAELWGWSETKVRDGFRDEPGVLQSQLRTLGRRKRQNVSLRIPESVLVRVHKRLSVEG